MFLAVLSVGGKQQRGSFFAGLEEQGRAGRGWGGKLEERGEAKSVRLWGQGPEGGPLASGMEPGTLPF